jgi:hypothetical protein
MTPREAVDHLAEFINRPSENDDREADAIEAVGVLDKLVAQTPTEPVYAELSWCVEDIHTILTEQGRTATQEEMEQWFSRNERHLRDRLCELGWGVIDTLLAMDSVGKRDDGADEEDESCPCDAGHPERCMDVGTESREREG